MIKANELRVGNAVLFDNSVDIVTSIGETMCYGKTHSHWYYDRLNPIPITAKILEKAGFLKEDWSYVFPFNGGNTAYSIEQYGSKFGFCYSGQVTKETWVEYLHQLQNLYHSLTGEELEIKNPV